jgi:hypothetical protein
LLEEAFLSNEDDIFESSKFSAASSALSPSSLAAISRSTVDIQSPAEVLDEESVGSHGGAESARANAWQANYVNKMKKTSKNMKHSSLHQMSRKSVGKKQNKKDRPLMQSGDAHVNGDCGSQIVNIKARISDGGRVNIALKGEDSDDANLEDLLFEDSDSDISVDN